MRTTKLSAAAAGSALIAGSILTIAGTQASAQVPAPEAVAARPILKVPFPCQQDWRGSTRSDHAGSPNRAMDMNKSGTSGDQDKGSPVKASAAGTVVKAGTGSGGLGRTIVINHAGGYSTMYSHLNSINVRVNQSVSATTTIGTVGDSGMSAGSAAHLHYEQHDRPNAGHAISIRFGRATNALYYGERVYTRTNC